MRLYTLCLVIGILEDIHNPFSTFFSVESNPLTNIKYLVAVDVAFFEVCYLILVSCMSRKMISTYKGGVRSPWFKKFSSKSARRYLRIKRVNHGSGAFVLGNLARKVVTKGSAKQRCS